MKNLKLLALSTIAAASLAAGLTQAAQAQTAQWDPTKVIAEFIVTKGPDNALDTNLRYNDQSFLTPAQTQADDNSSLDGQFQLMGVQSTEGITVTPYGDNNGTGPVFTLQRTRRGSALEMGVAISVPLNTNPGEYQVIVMVKNLKSNETRALQVLVKVQ